jgi:hypothetical protein
VYRDYSLVLPSQITLKQKANKPMRLSVYLRERLATPRVATASNVARHNFSGGRRASIIIESI